MLIPPSIRLGCKISPQLPRCARDMGRNDKARRIVGANIGVEPDDFEYAPFAQEGGLGKMHQLFGAELTAMIEELNGALAA